MPGHGQEGAHCGLAFPDAERVMHPVNAARAGAQIAWRRLCFRHGRHGERPEARRMPDGFELQPGDGDVDMRHDREVRAANIAVKSGLCETSDMFDLYVTTLTQNQKTAKLTFAQSVA